ncbi:MAG: hypothetical protein J6J67_05475 [Treponema sp.]|nr:hypothetical protein [Treponema sp.]
MKKKIFSSFIFVFIISNFIFALPGFKPYLKDVSGDFVFYKDYTFKRESYVGFLMYDEGTYCARYFAPKNEEKPAKDVKILFTVNTDKDFMELTGEKIISGRQADDTEVINYLHDMIYELNARRIKAGSVAPKDVDFSDDDVPFLRQGKIVADEFMQFGGDVKVVYDYVVPLFNVKAVYDYSGDAKFEVATIGRLTSSDDNSFDDFAGFAELENFGKDAKKKSVAAKKIKVSKKDVVINKTEDGQVIALDSGWSRSMDNLWMRGNDAVISAIKVSKDFGAENELQADLGFILKQFLINASGVYRDWKSLFVDFDDEDIKFQSLVYQPGKVTRNFIIIESEDEADDCAIMTLSVFENVYKKNSKYFNEILDSYSGFAD